MINSTNENRCNQHFSGFIKTEIIEVEIAMLDNLWKKESRRNPGNFILKHTPKTLKKIRSGRKKVFTHYFIVPQGSVLGPIHIK